MKPEDRRWRWWAAPSIPPSTPQAQGRAGWTSRQEAAGAGNPGEPPWHLGRVPGAKTHPEHLPQVGVPEPEGDVGDVEPLGLLLLCGVGGVERLAVRLCRFICLLWREGCSQLPSHGGGCLKTRFPHLSDSPPRAGTRRGVWAENAHRARPSSTSAPALPPLGLCPAVPQTPARGPVSPCSLLPGPGLTTVPQLQGLSGS